MTADWIGTIKDLRAGLREMRAGAPEVMKAFAGIAQAALQKNVLDGKTKELIALAVSVAVRCDDCIAFHAKAAVDQGATSDEIHETLGMAIYMGAGPAAMYAAHALQAYTQFAEAKKSDAAAGGDLSRASAPTLAGRRS